MKKKILTALFFAGAALAPVAHATEEIVFIDLNRVFREFYKTKLADTQLQAQRVEMEDAGKVLVERFQELQTEYEKLKTEAQDVTLSEEVQAAKRDEAEEALIAMQEKELEINEFRELNIKQLQVQKDRMRQRILQEIREAVHAQAELNGYNAVVNSGARGVTSPDVVVYVDARADITQSVIDILNKGHLEEEPDAETEETETEAETGQE